MIQRSYGQKKKKKFTFAGVLIFDFPEIVYKVVGAHSWEPAMFNWVIRRLRGPLQNFVFNVIKILTVQYTILINEYVFSVNSRTLLVFLDLFTGSMVDVGTTYHFSVNLYYTVFAMIQLENTSSD